MRHLTKDHKRKIGESNSKILLGRKITETHRHNIKIALNREEVKNKIRKNSQKLKINIDENKLKELYLAQRKTAKRCSEYFGCSEGCIVKRLKIYKIQRTKSESKKGELNPMFGKKSINAIIKSHSPEALAKSKETKNKLRSLGLLKSRLGQKSSIETIKKLHESHIKYFENNPQERLRLKELRKNQILPLKDTTIEVKIQNFLKQLNIEFYTHQYIKDIEHAYQCDIFIPSKNLVIECDGNYWHSYPTGTETDHIRTKELIEKGFKVLRLWEIEIRSMEIEDFQNKLNRVCLD